MTPRSARSTLATSEPHPGAAHRGPRAADAPLLAVVDVHTYDGDSYVLQGLTLAVPRGQIVALLGRNGMGKTTLIRSVAGLTPPRAGTIAFDGVPVNGLRPHAIAQRGIGLVPQGRRTFPSLTVRENLLLPTSVLAGRRARGGTSGERWPPERGRGEVPHLAEPAGPRPRAP